MSESTVVAERTPGVKMQYLIKRRAEATREELIAHWFANHMPGVIEFQGRMRKAGNLHAKRYIATLFDAAEGQDWDGVAQLWFDEALPQPREAHGTKPRDTFQQKAEPYRPWATIEHVVLDDVGRLTVEPLTLNDPFPSTRSGFFKATVLTGSREGVDRAEMHSYWIDEHAPRVAETLRQCGGLRYVVSLSLDAEAPYAGMAELYFEDAASFTQFGETVRPDRLQEWIDPEAMRVFTSGTEMIGIP